MLINTVTPPTDVVYPCLETTLRYKRGSYEVEYLVPSCCFHDLLNVRDEELAGMGLAISGNFVKQLSRSDTTNPCLYAELRLKRAKSDAGVLMPWPGLSDDRPAPLDLAKMPWDNAMFLDEHKQLKYRVNRLQLMHNIEAIWVPHLKGLLKRETLQHA